MKKRRNNKRFENEKQKKKKIFSSILEKKRIGFLIFFRLSSSETLLTPSQILSQDKYFEEVFNLLRLPAPICLSVWELLMKVPTNVSMKFKLKEIKVFPSFLDIFFLFFFFFLLFLSPLLSFFRFLHLFVYPEWELLMNSYKRQYEI